MTEATTLDREPQTGKRANTAKSLTTTKDSALDAARRTAQSVESNPLSVLVGGVALGVLIGAILPRLAQEKELLAPVGKRIADTTSAAVQAAREAGKAELDAVLPNKDSARDQVGKILQTVFEAARGATKTA
jgi:hypothetical protein